MGTILAVDDEPHILDLVVRVLEDRGHSTYSASTGEQAIEVLESNPVDVVVLDLELPGMSGTSVLESIRSFWPDTVVVCTTACGTIRGAVNSLHSGAFDYIEKPFDISEFRTIVDRSLEVTKSRQENVALLDSQDLPLDAPVRSDPIYRDLEPAGTMLEKIASLSSSGNPRPVDVKEPPDSWQLQMAAAVAKSLTEPMNQAPPVFWALARGFRLMSSEPLQGPRDLAESVHRMVRKSADLSAKTRPKTREIARTLENIMAASRGRLTLPQLAQELGLNRAYLSRLLKLETGLNFRQWRWAILMRTAVRRLAVTDEHVKQIASAIGYEDVSQFDRDFNRVFGMSAVQFRRLAQRALASEH